MGTIRIYDGTEVAEYESPRWEGQLLIDLASPDHPKIVARSEGPMSPQLETVPPDGDPTATEVGSPSTSFGSPTTRTWWSALLPAGLTLVLLAVGFVLGIDVFRPGSPGYPAVVGYAVLVPYFLVALRGTLWLYDDAERLRAADAEWTPNPWPYVVGGALGLTLARGALPGVEPGLAVTDARALLGVFVVGLAVSSILAGPAYLLERRRHLGWP